MRKATPVLTALLTLAALAVAPALASTPADSGTVSPSLGTGVVTKSWSGTIAGANAFNDCGQALDDSLNDHHTFKLVVPEGFYDGTRHVILSITELAVGADSILTVNRDGKSVSSSDSGGPSAGEAFAINDPTSAAYDALVCSFAGASPYDATLTLKTTIGAAGSGVGGTSTTAGTSTYANYPLEKIPGADQSGEPSIGVDWKTGNVYFQANLVTVKAEFSTIESALPHLSDVSCLVTTANTLDPIMFTDSLTGRTGVSQLVANPLGLNSITAFFEGDPESTQATCDPSTGGGVIAGPDHQTLGGGAYPKALPTLAGPTGAYPNAMYYCSQTLLAGALCSRSDDGGTTFVNGQPPYTTQCGGLHGHVRVGPNGTVYLPNRSCGAGQGVAVSSDAGQTWTIRPVTGSTPGATDPSVYADRAGNVYFGYISGDGRPTMTTSHDQGKTWDQPVLVGAAAGIKNAVFAEVIAGDDGRAAMAFLGTTTAGDRNVAEFGKSADGKTYTSGRFDLYVATTIDGGRSYNTVNATPNDPVQRGMICTNGTTCLEGRNLLDFNDITVDKQGRVLIGYADGCTLACVDSNAVSTNKQTAYGVIARQVAGPRLFLFGSAVAAPPAAAPPGAPAPPPVAAPPSSGGNLAATGRSALFPTLAGLLMLLAAAVVRSRRRTSI